MPVARQWLSKCHMTATTLMYITVGEVLEAVFSMRSTATAMSHYNKANASEGIFCVVRAEAI